MKKLKATAALSVTVKITAEESTFAVQNKK